MGQTTLEKLQKGLLLFVAVGLVPIALGYGPLTHSIASITFSLSLYTLLPLADREMNACYVLADYRASRA